MTKTLEIHYSQQADGFVPGRTYANPRFFSTPRAGATKVFIYGDYPAIEAAYAANGVPVERGDPRPLVAPVAIKPPVAVATPEEAATVEIPANWRDLPWSKPGEDGLTLRGLASKVSPVPVTSGDQARAAIEAELANRGQVQAEETEA